MKRRKERRFVYVQALLLQEMKEREEQEIGLGGGKGMKKGLKIGKRGIKEIGI